MFTKSFDRRVYTAASVLLGAIGLGVSFGVYALWPSRVEAGFAPVQPLPFDHQLHAGTLRIDCQYCHAQASRGPQATVPALSVCMGCHAKVQPKDASGNVKPAVAELLRRWQARESIAWVKVNDVADFVYFDHSRHVTSGIACQTCHGPVETMTVLRREQGLKMAFCLDCHKQPPTGAAAAPAGAPVAPRTGTRAPIHCTTCHR